MRRSRSEVGALTDVLVEKTGTRIPVAEEGEPGDSKTKTDPAPPPSERARPPLFASVHLGDGDEVRPDYARIVETVYAADAFKDYDDLERHLEVGEGRGDYATLREELDKAESRARRAHRIYLGAKIELVRWEVSQKKVEAGMREKARNALENEKASGERTKRITIDDVSERVVEMFPDEAAHQEVARAKLKGVVESMEHLASRWNSKCGDLRTLLETLRK